MAETNTNTQSSTDSLAETSVQPVSKEEMITHIKKWMQYDNDIKQLQNELKTKKENRRQHTEQLVNIMKSNEIDCFDITNGKIVYSKTKTRPPLNKGQLKSALMTYYKDDAETASSLNEFLIASRVEKVREAIKMKIPK
jgi:DUF917 family protein